MELVGVRGKECGEMAALSDTDSTMDSGICWVILYILYYIILYYKVKLSRYTSWRRFGGEDV
jgi:hypothetical protein